MIGLWYIAMVVWLVVGLMYNTIDMNAFLIWLGFLGIASAIMDTRFVGIEIE